MAFGISVSQDCPSFVRARKVQGKELSSAVVLVVVEMCNALNALSETSSVPGSALHYNNS